MKWFHIAALAVLASAALGVEVASALSEDDKSMSTSTGDARFSDPDDITPGTAVYMQGSKAASGDVDPSSIRYDYDPTTGSSTPHKQ